MKEYKINSEIALADTLNEIRQEWNKHHYIEITVKRNATQRTLTQNASLHLFCKQLAQVLNDAGYDMKRTLKPEAEIPWTLENVKENLWKPIQKALTNKKSTTELTTVEPTIIHETLCRHLGQKLGIDCPEWPKKKV